MAGLSKKFRRTGRKTNLPATKPQTPVTASGDGAVIRSAGKYARNVVLAVFEQIGGQDQMAVWATANQGEFYTKLFGKTITRESEHTRIDTVETLLDEIDAEDANKDAVDAEFEDV